jgi:DNA-binding transcriptional ArsR family regulator
MLTEREIRSKRKLLNETDRLLASTLKALGDVTRLRIFRLLTDHPEISVGTIAKILHVSTPLASQHIKILVHARLLKKSRTGKKIFSQLNRSNPLALEMIKAIQRSMASKPSDVPL